MRSLSNSIILFRIFSSLQKIMTNDVKHFRHHRRDPWSSTSIDRACSGGRKHRQTASHRRSIILASSFTHHLTSGSSSGSQGSGEASSAPSVVNLIDETDEYRVGYSAPLEALPLEADLLDPASSLFQRYEILRPHF